MNLKKNLEENLVSMQFCNSIDVLFRNIIKFSVIMKCCEMEFESRGAKDFKY